MNNYRYEGIIKNPQTALDITGQRFGRLTAIKPTGQREGTYVVWEFLCDCGNTTYKKASRVKVGHVKSCGCLSPKRDLTGQVFGRLTVINRARGDIGQQKGIAMWLCKCECGNIISDTTNAIVSGNRRSCSCLGKENLIKGR